jgi:hypothetical protein
LAISTLVDKIVIFGAAAPCHREVQTSHIFKKSGLWRNPLNITDAPGGMQACPRRYGIPRLRLAVLPVRKLSKNFPFL